MYKKFSKVCDEIVSSSKLARVLREFMDSAQKFCHTLAELFFDWSFYHLTVNPICSINVTGTTTSLLQTLNPLTVMWWYIYKIQKNIILKLFFDSLPWALVSPCRSYCFRPCAMQEWLRKIKKDGRIFTNFCRVKEIKSSDGLNFGLPTGWYF